MRRLVLPLCSSLRFSLTAAFAADPAPNTLTDAEKAAGWKLLFDGKTTNGWRNYKKTDIAAGLEGRGRRARSRHGTGAATSSPPTNTARSSCRSNTTSRRAATAA